MAKIAELKATIHEVVNRNPLSATAQRVIKAAQEISRQQGFNLKQKLKSISDDLKQVKSEAKGLDHKTVRKLDTAIADLSSLSFYIDKHGLKAVESNED